MGDAQCFAAIFYQFSLTSGDDSNFDTGCDRTANSVAVAYVKGFQLFAIIAHKN
ncbi:hypothetical protein D3C76_1607640 [compost metagenome]